MKYIKTFENINSKNPSDYYYKFFITTVPYDTAKFLVLTDNTLELESTSYDGEIHPRGDCFKFTKSCKFGDPSGWGYSYNREAFDKIEFMTPQEFYDKHTELCTKLFKYINNLIEKNLNQYSEWYVDMIKKYKKALDTIREFEYYEQSKKYNL